MRMKKIVCIVLLLALHLAGFAGNGDSGSPGGQSEFFKIMDEMPFAPYPRQKDLNNNLLHLGKAGNPCAWSCYAATLDAINQHYRLIGEAFPQLLAWAQKGHWLACEYVSFCFWNGLGCERDDAAAARWS